MESAKKVFHYCTGKKVCDHPSHEENYDEGGSVGSGIMDTVKKYIAPDFDKADKQASQPLPPPAYPMDMKAEGGEIEGPMDGSDDELMDMAAGELMQAWEKKDKKGMIDAIRALVLSCKE